MSITSSSEDVATIARKLTGFQSLFGTEAVLLCEAAVMRRYAILANAIGEMPGDTLGQTACVDEQQRCPVGLDQLREAVVDFPPDLVRHDRLEG